jgi:hypothetical protein
MPNDDLNQFTQIVLAASELPKWVHDSIGNARGVEQHVLNQSYLKFLEEQIKLSPRGPKWAEELQKRLDALTPCRGKMLLSGTVVAGSDNCYLKMDPESKRVLYWEIYTVKKSAASPS